MFLENAVFTGLTQGAFLPAGDFVIGAAAADATDRIIYNSATATRSSIRTGPALRRKSFSLTSPAGLH